jgi:acyl-CoA synthetase (AMP-forming)/AMP-acid ligase II
LSGNYNLSELIERTAEAVPDRMAVIAENRELTFSQLDQRANQLAGHLQACGVGPGDMVGLHLYNGTEYVEAMLAAFKIRAVPVNINYRYVENELEYLYRYTDLTAVVFHRALAPAVIPVARKLTAVRHLIAVDDDSNAALPADIVDYETVLAAQPPHRSFSGRSSDDIYVTCTGGTTGLPKAVMWRHEDLFFAAFNGGDITGRLGPVSDPQQLVERVSSGPPIVQLSLAPLMHVTGHWAVLAMAICGGTTILAPPGSFDPVKTWQLVAQHRVNLIGLVGDAMARPLIEAYQRDPFPVPTLWAIGSGGARISPSTKESINAALPHVAILDGLGSSETGVLGRNLSVAGQRHHGRFPIDETIAVLDENLRPLPPGSTTAGTLARCGHVPLGYYNDEAKTKRTFVEIDGRRWVLTGDFAVLESDGSVTLCGRGSSSINTGGEKVFPDEIEQVLIEHPGIVDVLVVGKPDPRWGERVVAIVQGCGGAVPTLDDIRQHARTRLAGYKLPQEVIVVDLLQRLPSGKPDLQWAKALASTS